MTMADRRAELLTDVSEQASVMLVSLGFAVDVAEQAGHWLADFLVMHWGGQVISFPTDRAFKLSKRDREMLAAYQSGTSVVELSRRYSISENGLRKALRRIARRAVMDAEGAASVNMPRDRARRASGRGLTK